MLCPFPFSFFDFSISDLLLIDFSFLVRKTRNKKFEFSDEVWKQCFYASNAIDNFKSSNVILLKQTLNNLRIAVLQWQPDTERRSSCGKMKSIL